MSSAVVSKAVRLADAAFAFGGLRFFLTSQAKSRTAAAPGRTRRVSAIGGPSSTPGCELSDHALLPRSRTGAPCEPFTSVASSGMPSSPDRRTTPPGRSPACGGCPRCGRKAERGRRRATNNTPANCRAAEIEHHLPRALVIQFIAGQIVAGQHFVDSLAAGETTF